MTARQQPEVCYLCGQRLTEPTSDDHVPPQAFFPTEIRRRHHPTQLVTIPVHKACNESYESDEKYFRYSLYPLAMGTYVGNEMHKHIRKKFRAGKDRKLVAMMMAEFEHRPSGLVLPYGQVKKHFDSERIERVLWKIVRGLYFYHHNKVLPENWQKWWSFNTPRHEPELPEHFKLFRDLPGNDQHGPYEAVFSYRFQHFIEPGKNLHYWALMIWESILVTMQFHDPATASPGQPHE